MELSPGVKPRGVGDQESAYVCKVGYFGAPICRLFYYPPTQQDDGRAQSGANEKHHR